MEMAEGESVNAVGENFVGLSLLERVRLVQGVEAVPIQEFDVRTARGNISTRSTVSDIAQAAWGVYEMRNRPGTMTLHVHHPPTLPVCGTCPAHCHEGGDIGMEGSCCKMRLLETKPGKLGTVNRHLILN